VYIEKDFPRDWAMAQNNLGNSHGDLTAGDRNANLQNAIRYYLAALRVYTEQDLPVEWAMAQNNLGTAYSGLPSGRDSARRDKVL
jgi:hypothetical protein